MKKDSLEKMTPWSVFVWTVGIVTLLLMSVLGLQAKQQTDISSIKTDVATTKNDVSWIKASITASHNAVSLESSGKQ